MIQNVLRQLGGVEGYGVVSICLFFACFLGVLFWAWRLKKPFLKTMASLPLESETEEAIERKTDHE